jgi:hypothetical protein
MPASRRARKALFSGKKAGKDRRGQAGKYKENHRKTADENNLKY